MTDIRARILRVLHAEMNLWTAEFTQTAAAVPAGVRAGKIPAELLDAYVSGGVGYPVELSRDIAHRIGLPMTDEPAKYEGAFLLNVTAEAIGVGIDAMHGLLRGAVGITEDGYGGTWSFYRETLDTHDVTIEQLREQLTGLTWNDAAALICDAYAVPIEVANARTICGTGGFVTRWLRPGDHTKSGWPVPQGQHGMRIAGIGAEITGNPADLAEWGERMAMRWQSPLVMALSDMGDALHHDSEPGFTSFPQALGCRAVDALAKVLAMTGHHDAAVQVIAAHAEADVGEEAHAPIRELAQLDEDTTANGQTVVYELRDSGARDYLRDLLGKAD